MKNTKKHILLIRSGYPSKKFVLEKLKQLGYYIIILDSKKTCPNKYADDWIIEDLADFSGCIKAVDTYLQKKGNYIDGALTFWEEAVVVTAKITTHFGWAGIPEKTATSIKNKHSFRKFCKEYDLPAPKHAIVKNPEDFEFVKKNLTFPLVIKPVFGAASAFVMKANTIKELQQHYTTINTYIQTFWLTPEWHGTDIFTEEYIDGQEVDIDILLQNGELKFYSITDNFQTNEPYFVETGQAIPSRLSQEKQDELITMATNVLKKCGVTDGCIHFEAKSSSLGPIPIEINLRMGGDEVYSFIKHAWKVDLIEYAAAIAVRTPIVIYKPEKPYLYLEGKYFLPESDGEIADVTIDPELTTNPHIFEIHLSKKKGEFIFMPPKDFDYFGWITTVGRTPEEASEELARSFHKVLFVTLPYEEPQLQAHI